MEEGLRTYLLSKADVTEIVGQRFFAARMPANQDYPALVFQRRSTQRDHHQGGALGPVAATTALYCLSDDYTEAKDIASIIRRLIDGAHNTTWGDTQIAWSVVADESDQMYQPIDGGDVGYYARILVLNVTYVETLPTV